MSVRKLQLSQRRSAATSGREGRATASGGRAHRACSVRAEKLLGQRLTTKTAGPNEARSDRVVKCDNNSKAKKKKSRRAW